MKKTNVKKLLLSALGLTLVAVLTVAGTLAYLQDESQEIVNTFKANNITVELWQTPVNDMPDFDHEIIPGTTVKVDPTVKVKTSVPAYVFVEVTDKTWLDDVRKLVEFTVDGWTEVDGFPGVYSKAVDASDDVQEFNVLAGDKVTYSPELTNEDMLKEDGETLKEGITLTFKASAIQQEGFADAKAAWLKVPAEAASSKEILEAFEAGKSVTLDDHVTVEKTENPEYNMAPDAVLNLNEKTLTTGYMDAIFQGDNITIQNGSIASTGTVSYGLWIGNGTMSAENPFTTATVENVSLTGGINVFVADVTLRNVTIDASSREYYAVWADEAATITIESGTYIGGTKGGKAMPAVLACNLGTIIIKGGSFNTDVSAYVADGYKVQEKTDAEGKTWYNVVPVTP